MWRKFWKAVICCSASSSSRASTRKNSKDGRRLLRLSIIYGVAPSGSSVDDIHLEVMQAEKAKLEMEKEKLELEKQKFKIEIELLEERSSTGVL